MSSRISAPTDRELDQTEASGQRQECRALDVGLARVIVRLREDVRRRRARSSRRCRSGSGNHRARTRVVRRAGRAARRRQSIAVGMVRGRHGADRAASVGPNRPTMGTSDVEATCSGPLSPPMNKAARSIKARSSASDMPSPSTMRPPARPAARSRRRQHARRGLAIGRPAREHDPAIGARRDQVARERGERRLGPAPKRIARAHVNDHDPRVVRHAAAPPAADRPPRAPPDRPASRRDRSPDPRGRGERRIDLRQQIPLVLDRVARAKLPRPVDDMRVHPRPALHIVAHSPGRPAGPGEPRAAGPAVKVDGDVDAQRAQPPRQLHVVGHAPPAADVRHGDDVGQMRIVGHDGEGARFDHIRQLSIRIVAGEGANRRRREHHVTDEPQPEQEDAHKSRTGLVLDFRLVNQHHRDVILDGIDPATFFALERGAVFHEPDRRLALRAHQDFEQRGVDGHEGTIIDPSAHDAGRRSSLR